MKVVDKKIYELIDYFDRLWNKQLFLSIDKHYQYYQIFI